jgi:predicted transcriptional regulator
MSPSPETLGRQELAILRFIAEHHPVTVRDVAAHFAETSGLARTTVLTVMQRLLRKGYLTRRKRDGMPSYSSALSSQKLLDQVVGEFVDEVLGGAVSPFVAYLTRSAHLSSDEVRKLEKLLDQLESREKGGPS